MTQLLMRREDLLNLPDPVLPPDMRIRRATAADAPAIAAVVAAAFAAADNAPATEEAVMTRLFLHPIVRGVLVVVDAADKVLATASVAYRPDRFGDVGYVHWVATDPTHAGQGLGRAVTAAVLKEFADLGLVAAVLETDDHRLPAVITYTRLGFHPVLYERDHPSRWAAVWSAIETEKAARGAGNPAQAI